MKFRLTALASVLVLALAGCGSDDATSASSDAAVTGGGGATELDIDMTDEMAFEPSSIEVPPDEPITLNLVNTGAMTHDLVLDDGFESPDVMGGETATVEVGPFTESTTGWCSIPGHREAGMELEIVVTDG